MEAKKRTPFASNRQPTFAFLWKGIRGKENEHIEFSKSFPKIKNEPFFTEIPDDQSDLTGINEICDIDLDFSGYYPSMPNQIDVKNLFDCFCGILYKIAYNSNNKLNRNEIEFHFSGAKVRPSYEKIISDPTKNRQDQWNILNIFTYNNLCSQFVVNRSHEAFFGVTFKRIKIKPLAYAIRSGILTNCDTHLVSFTFEGYDEDTKTWDVLDERLNINDLIPSGGFSLFFTRTTDKYYSSFQIRQTEPGNNGFWGFSLCAFDIHGTVSYRNDCFSKNISIDPCLFTENKNDFELNPLINMDVWIDEI